MLDKVENTAVHLYNDHFILRCLSESERRLCNLNLHLDYSKHIFTVWLSDFPE